MNLIDSVFDSSLNQTQKYKYLDKFIDEDFLSENCNVNHEVSIYYYKKNDLLNAIKFAEYEINCIGNKAVKSKKYINAIYNLGFFYYKKNNYNKSIKKFKEVVNISLDSSFSAKSYCKIAGCYRKMGDFTKSILYYKKGIYLLTKQKKYSELFTYYNQLFLVYTNYDDNENLENQFSILKKIKALEPKIELNNQNFYQMNNNFAFYYLNDSIYNLKKVKQYYLKNLNKSLAFNEKKMISNMYLNIGNLYLNSSSDSAFHFLKKALNYNRDNNFQSKVHHNISIFYKNKKQYNVALKHIDNAIILSFNNKPISYSFNGVKSVFNKRLLVSTLQAKINLLLDIYILNKERKNIYQVINTIKSAEKILNIIKHESTEGNSKLYWSKEASTLYSKAIYCAKQVNDIEMSFNYFEKNKALLLLKNLNDRKLRSIIPEGLKNREIEIQKKIYKNEEMLTEVKNIDSLSNIIFNQKMNLFSIRDTIAAEKSNLNKITLFSEVISYKSVVSKLKQDEVILMYQWNTLNKESSSIYGLFISKNYSEIFEIENLKKFNENLLLFQESIARPFKTNSDVNDFKKHSFFLFDKLFNSNKIKEIIKNKKLIIIPDNKLQFIPFESLITSSDKLNYLVFQNDISYSNSMTFLKKNSLSKRKPVKNFIGIAPNQYTYNDLDRLKYSVSEVKSIKMTIDGKIYINKDATKENFLNECSNYNIIHLATHSGDNKNKSPWIAFRNKKLLFSELYTTEIQADLVVLSACSTNIGEIFHGEGVFSMARGFFHSGAKTVVSTLWNINDQSTNNIMVDFYKNMNKGLSKSKSLQVSKINYINNNSLSNASPYYWSSFVLAGDYGRLHQLKSYKKEGILFFVIIFILIIWVTKKQIS